ncbi:MAG: hypothetical protein AB9M53_00430 [Leptothrix sp. (in: b-proteobacteria)]
MPHYRILPGASFRDSDGSVKTAGELIDLGDDLAALHADKVERANVEAPPADIAIDPAA